MDTASDPPHALQQNLVFGGAPLCIHGRTGTRRSCSTFFVHREREPGVILCGGSPARLWSMMRTPLR